MRELALITFRIVDETTKLQPSEVNGLYTSDYANGSIRSSDHMQRLAVGELVDGDSIECEYVYQPRSQMTVVQIEPCNPDSALGVMLACLPDRLVSGCLGKLTNAGLTLLDHENDDRSRIHEMSKTLGGDGVEPTDMVQFYAVFAVSVNPDIDSVEGMLEGVLRLDKIDMAIDEAVLL